MELRNIAPQSETVGASRCVLAQIRLLSLFSFPLPAALNLMHGFEGCCETPVRRETSLTRHPDSHQSSCVDCNRYEGTSFIASSLDRFTVWVK